eukprot:GFYU01013972.1.p1 GENE.GFYU01013972.1~~GFYU01013972.1.p1  ORF type:complete len:388 (+),score=95.13 GFYU01013972.1:157-1320(+)
MGGLFSYFRKPTEFSAQYEQIFESYEKEMKEIRDTITETQSTKRRVIGSVIFYTVALYIIVLAYTYYQLKFKTYITLSPQHQWALYVAVVLTPFIIYFIRWILISLFDRRVDLLETKLKERRDLQTQTIKEFKEKTNFERHRQLMERFENSGGSPSKTAPAATSPKKNGGSPSKSPRRGGGGGRMNQNVQHPPHVGGRVQSASNASQGVGHGGRTPYNSTADIAGRPQFTSQGDAAGHATRQSFLDRVLDALSGDGKNQRYALICGRCSSHNGLAMEEDFYTIQYRCPHCNYHNPPRRPLPMPSGSGSQPATALAATAEETAADVDSAAGIVIGDPPVGDGAGAVDGDLSPRDSPRDSPRVPENNAGDKDDAETTGVRKRVTRSSRK